MQFDNNFVMDIRYTDPKTGFTLVGKSNAQSNPRRHFHDYWEILYIVEGERNFFYGNKTYYLQSGDFLCVQPGVLHRAINETKFNDVKICKLYNIYFEGSKNQIFYQLVLPKLQQLFYNNGVVNHVAKKYQNTVLAEFNQIATEFFNSNNNYEIMVLSSLLKILTLVSRSEQILDFQKEQSYKQKKCQAIINYIENNFNKSLSLDEISSKFAMSTSYFCRFFKNSTHLSFIEYLNGLRVSKACYLLKNTNKKITDIAFDCGFGTITQFGRIFKSFTGTSPLKYRKNEK